MTHANLPGVFGDLAPVLNQYGYLAVGGFLFLEDFGVPAPGETILIAAAVYAGAGQLNIVWVVLVAIAAAILGDNTGYAIGRFGGRQLVLRWGRYVFVTEARLAKAQDFFERHGGKVVVVARFIEGLRQFNGVVAGVSEMRWRRFIVFNALGATLWVGVWSSIGYFAGDHVGYVYDQARRYSIYLLVAVALLVLALVARHLLRRRRAREESEEKSDSRAG